MITTYINDYQMIAMMLLPLGFSASTFYLAENVPYYINVVVSINSLTYQVSILRSITFSIINPLALIIGFTALSLIAGVRVLERSVLVIKGN